MGKIIRFDLMVTEKEVRKLNEDLETLQRTIAAAEKDINETEAALKAELACRMKDRDAMIQPRVQ